jgi:hypothetical protein
MAKASSLAEFSAGTSPLEVYRAQLEALPPTAIPGGEHTAVNPGVEFSAPGARAIAEKIETYQAEQEKLGKTVSPADALRHVKAQMNG